MAQSNSTNRTRKNNSSNRTRSSSNTRSNTNNRKTTTKSTSKKPSNTSRSSSKSEIGLSFADYWYEFQKSRFFKPVLVIAIPIILVLLDLLFAWNNFDRFFIILGVELLIVAALWVIGFVFNMSTSSSSNSESPE